VDFSRTEEGGILAGHDDYIYGVNKLFDGTMPRFPMQSMMTGEANKKLVVGWWGRAGSGMAGTEQRSRRKEGTSRYVCIMPGAARNQTSRSISNFYMY